ncbi:hypothetical protein PSDVSF_04910 [Pseudodesulfovibrio sediminis]|uniref:Organic solvent tolerance-like N-terminal domain-containing protein n=2 Tax=Pseudodesulfovibrio sediminis TaxID=2810563 RepID=A0ABM7P392_9BACT|nr:hypothetical protein PSDVSF_04910 [Pseudodesulfovibrio sediminis]
MNIRILLSALVLLTVLLPTTVLAQEWGELRQATVNLNVRELPDKTSEHVLTLAKGQRVKCDFLENGWIAVFNINEKVRDKAKAVGYANAKYLEVVPKSVQKPTSKPEQKPTSQTVVEAPSGEGEVKAPVADTPPDPVLTGIDPNRVPVKITSDRMTYDESGKVVSFVGNVVAVHGELTLWANSLSAFLSSKTGKKFSADSIDRIIAKGNVKAVKGKSQGTCGKLTYFVEAQLLKMEQNPLLQDGPNSLSGEVVKFHLKDNRSEVVGGKSQRVKAIFMTPDKIKGQ